MCIGVYEPWPGYTRTGSAVDRRPGKAPYEGMRPRRPSTRRILIDSPHTPRDADVRARAHARAQRCCTCGRAGHLTAPTPTRIPPYAIWITGYSFTVDRRPSATVNFRRRSPPSSPPPNYAVRRMKIPAASKSSSSLRHYPNGPNAAAKLPVKLPPASTSMSLGFPASRRSKFKVVPLGAY